MIDFIVYLSCIQGKAKKCTCFNSIQYVLTHQCIWESGAQIVKKDVKLIISIEFQKVPFSSILENVIVCDTEFQRGGYVGDFPVI